MSRTYKEGGMKGVRLWFQYPRKHKDGCNFCKGAGGWEGNFNIEKNTLSVLVK